jgi:hypothetical protein
MNRKALLAGITMGVFALASTAFAAENPLTPSYQNAQTKKYVMEFCNLDKDSDGMVTAAEYLNKGNPLSPGFEKNPKWAKKYEMWKAMAGDGDKISMEAFVAYMDKNNPLNPNFKK